MKSLALLSCSLAAAVSSATVTSSVARDLTTPTSERRASKKATAEPSPAVQATARPVTLVQTHTGERVAFDAGLTQARFEQLLADHTTGEVHAIDPAMLPMLVRLVATLDAPTIEIVSGYRSEKLNEMLRKKGHHVASHSQHSLGHAVDFRLEGVSPTEVERTLRALGWSGGIGVYLSPGDMFTHMDTGPNRRW